jgi:hypothetical protein
MMNVRKGLIFVVMPAFGLAGCMSLQHSLAGDAHAIHGPEHVVHTSVASRTSLGAKCDVCWSEAAEPGASLTLDVLKSEVTRETHQEVISSWSSCTCWPQYPSFLGLFETIIIVGEGLTIVPLVTDYLISSMMGHEGMLPPSRHGPNPSYSTRERLLDLQSSAEAVREGTVRLTVDSVTRTAVIGENGRATFPMDVFRDRLRASVEGSEGPVRMDCEVETPEGRYHTEVLLEVQRLRKVLGAQMPQVEKGLIPQPKKDGGQ